MSRILVVEDEEHLAEGLRFNLVAEHYDVEVVDTGEAALARLMADPIRFDLVILDVMLPGITGFSVAAELRRAGQFVPVLMLTARGRAEDVLQGFQSGADDYLPKPFELPILIARVQGCCAGGSGSGSASSASRPRPGCPAASPSANGRSISSNSRSTWATRPCRSL